MNGIFAMGDLVGMVMVASGTPHRMHQPQMQSKDAMC
jgi:hypothetical protein